MSQNTRDVLKSYTMSGVMLRVDFIIQVIQIRISSPPQPLVYKVLFLTDTS